MSEGSGSTKRAWGGLLVHKPRWGISWRGWLVFFAIFAVVFWLVVQNAFTFLAVYAPVQTDVLVVEGWMDNWAFPFAAAEFQRGHYKMALSTGGPVVGTGGYSNDFNTVASVGAERLIAAGVPRELVRIVPSRESARDRTYSSAVALRRWLQENGKEIRAVNVVTQTTHARRSQMLFQKALGHEVEVGIIPILSPDFDSKVWWRYSEGVRDVIDEAMAYFYARLFFWPDR